MHPVRKRRLIIVLFIVFFASVAVGLMSYALRENINLFYSPTQVAGGEAPVDKRIRAGGCVVPGSVKREQENLDWEFLISDGAASLGVKYTGILPDMFDEGEAVVVHGRLDGDGIFQASQVLAKHDENYTPPEVAETLQGDEKFNQACQGIFHGT